MALLLGGLEKLGLALGVFVKLVLPVSTMYRRGNLHGGYFVLWTIRSPVTVLRSHYVSACFRIVERGVNDTGLYALSNSRSQSDFALAREKLDQHAFLDAPHFRITRMNFQQVGVVPNHVLCPTCLGAHVILRQDSTGCQQ